MSFPYCPKNLDIVWKPSTKTISVHFEIQILPNQSCSQVDIWFLIYTLDFPSRNPDEMEFASNRHVI